MRSLLFTSLVALAFATACCADLADNQIDDAPVPQSMMRARYAIRGCRACGQNQCQVMGMQRFSEPRCEALGELGAPCRPFQEAENKTLSFPHMLLFCNDVYMQFCPCSPGLVCDPERAECAYSPRSGPGGEPAQLPHQEDGYQFKYAEPERHTMDGGLEHLEVEDEATLGPFAPLTHLRQESQTIRRRPQWALM